MKKIVIVSLLTCFYFCVFSQQQIQDGVYLLDDLKSKKVKNSKPLKRIAIEFDPSFIKDDPEDYDPVIIIADEFVPLSLATSPLIRISSKNKKDLLLQLSGEETLRLKHFTTTHLGKCAVLVLNGKALTIPRINKTITSGLISIYNEKYEVYNELIEYFTVGR
jgi:hypothetical protein